MAKRGKNWMDYEHDVDLPLAGFSVPVPCDVSGRKGRLQAREKEAQEHRQAKREALAAKLPKFLRKNKKGDEEDGGD